jgi:periplasmic divalent cation tolerance protein
MDHLLVITTCPDAACAEGLADHLVREHLAACVNQLPGVRSTYEWQGKVTSDQEVLLLIKTRADAFERLEAAIKSRHPYQVPEVIALPIVRGSGDYLNWINSLVERNP